MFADNKKITIMKKVALFVSMYGILSSVSIAQTLNQSTHAPAIGDVYTFQYADPASLPSNLGNPGPGNTFNFSGLSIYPGTNTSQGVSVASTGSASAYPNANVAVQTGTDNVFYKSQPTKLDYYGGSINVGGYPVVLTFTSPATLGTYPMALGTTNTSTIAGTINFMGNNGNFVGTNSFTANATGTLVVPGGVSYSNVLRVQSFQNLTFTVAFVQGTLTVNQYDYYAPNYSNFPNPNNNWPVISVQQSTISSTIGGTSIQTTVTINSNYNVLGINNSNNISASHIMISPNPVKDVLTVSCDLPINKIQLVDITGKVIVDTKDNSIDCSTLSNGTYFVRMEDKSGKIITEKVVIQH
jgi:hypothetical protein